MDGESGQQPCVMGCIRSSIEGTEEEKKASEWISDLKDPGYNTNLVGSVGTHSFLANRSVNSTTADAADEDPGSVAGGNTNPNASAKDLGPNGAERREMHLVNLFLQVARTVQELLTQILLRMLDGTPAGGSINTFN